MATVRTSWKSANLVNYCSSIIRNYFVCVLILYVISGAQGCKFPKYLSESGMWMTHNQRGNNVRAYFQGSFLKASRCDSNNENCYTYQIKCLSKREDNKFQVQHNFQKNDPPKFSCMQILRRSANIIQIRESQQALFRSPNACLETHMILDNWPMTATEGFDKQKVPCPFSGGYNIRFQTSDQNPICATEITPTRLESECESGDGMTLNFHSEECMDSRLEMEKEQALYCAATWVHGNYTFVMVRPQNDEYKVWCMRLKGTDMNKPLKGGEIFINVVCDPGDGSGTIRETSNYLNIEFEQRIISSTCADSYGFCDDRRTCKHEKYSTNCRKMCRACGDSMNQCNFPPSLDGSWIESERGVKGKYLEVTPYDLTIKGTGRFVCHEEDYDHDFQNNTMLLQTFDNGCFPRYACFEVRKPSSSILEYRLGNRVSWPVKNEENLKYDVCDESMFKASNKDKAIYGRNIAEKPMKIVVDSTHHYPIDCELKHWPWFRATNIYMQEENGCDVCLFHDHTRRYDTIISQPVNCSSANEPLQQKQYHCLGVFPLPEDDGTHAVVTRTLHTHQEYLCWVFIDGDQRMEIAGTVYVLEATFCSKVAIDALKNGNIQPLRMFSIPRQKHVKKVCPYMSADSTGEYLTPYVTPPWNTDDFGGVTKHTKNPDGGRPHTKPTDDKGRYKTTDRQDRTQSPTRTTKRPHEVYDPNRTRPTDRPHSGELASTANGLFSQTHTFTTLSLSLVFFTILSIIT